MRLISRSALRTFWTAHPDARAPLEAWEREAKRADWKSPQEVKTTFSSASILEGNRMVFNIKGNAYRLVVAIHYNLSIIYIRFIGTHAEYDQIDATQV